MKPWRKLHHPCHVFDSSWVTRSLHKLWPTKVNQLLLLNLTWKCRTWWLEVPGIHTTRRFPSWKRWHIPSEDRWRRMHHSPIRHDPDAGSPPWPWADSSPSTPQTARHGLCTKSPAKISSPLYGLFTNRGWPKARTLAFRKRTGSGLSDTQSLRGFTVPVTKDK